MSPTFGAPAAPVPWQAKQLLWNSAAASTGPPAAGAGAAAAEASVLTLPTGAISSFTLAAIRGSEAVFAESSVSVIIIAATIMTTKKTNNAASTRLKVLKKSESFVLTTHLWI